MQEESDDLSLLYKNTKQQVVHIKWDDGQMADFTVKPETFLNLKFPDGYQKLTGQWKDNRSLAITGVKALMETANGLRVNVEKPVIR